MYLLITILIFLASLLLILIVLVQNSKGGGLSSGFSATNQVMGVRKTTDFLEKGTWILAASLVVLCIAATAFTPRPGGTTKSAIEQQIQGVQAPNALPTFPQSVPQSIPDTSKTR